MGESGRLGRDSNERGSTGKLELRFVGGFGFGVSRFIDKDGGRFEG